MAGVPIFGFCASGVAVNAGVTTYFQGSSGAASTTEAEKRIKWGVGGTLTLMEVHLSANTLDITGTCTVNSRKDSGAGNMTVSFASGVTGTAQDTTHTDTMASGSYSGFQVVNTGLTGAVTVACANVLFSATSNTVSKWTSRNGSSGTSSTRYNVLNAQIQREVTEADVQVKAKAAGTMKNMWGYRSDTTNGTLTINARLGSANAGSPGTMSIAWAAATAGEAVDNTNTVTVAVDDLINTQHIIAGSGTVVWSNPHVIEFENTANLGIIIQSGQNPAANITRYIGAAGDGGSAYTTETTANVAALALSTYTVSKLQANVRSNGVTADSTLTTSKNASASSGQSATLTNATNGIFEDASGSDSLTATDTINLKLVTGATGTSLKLNAVSMLLTAPSTAKVGDYYYRLVAEHGGA